MTSLYLGKVFSEFQARNPAVSLDVVLMDRSVNPLGGRIRSRGRARDRPPIPGVIDVPLCAYPLALCCAPAYMQGKREPEHPSELVDHSCLTSVLLGSTWLFDSTRGPLSVEVHSRFHVNDGRVLREAARQGLGIAALPRYLVEEDLKLARLMTLLEEFPLGGVLAQGAGAEAQDEPAGGPRAGHFPQGEHAAPSPLGFRTR